MKIKILHTADNHLRASQYARPDRGLDFTQALNRVVDIAIKQKVDAILNSGDILDTTRPTARTVHDLNVLHYRLIEAGIPMYTISGNHDKTDPHWTSVIDVGHTDRGIVCVDNKQFEVKGLKVHGLPFTHNDAFLANLAELPKADILMWHGMIREFVGYPTDKALSLDDLPQGKYQMMLLGDVHVHEQKQLQDGTLVSYPGSTELCNQTEEFQKWVDIYEIPVDEPGDYTMESVKIQTRPAYAYRITSEEAVSEVLTKLAKVKDEKPMIFVSYTPDLDNVFARLTQVADPTQAIIRTKPLPMKSAPDPKQEATHDLQPLDFLDKFVAVGSPMFELGELLLNPQADAVSLVDAYVERELGEVYV